MRFFWTFWCFLGWFLAKLALSWWKMHLQHDSLPFLYFFCIFAFPYSPFLFFLLQWLTFYWACLRLKNFSESAIETGNFYHGAARCSGRIFCSKVFTQLSEHFLCISQAPLGWSLWSGHHWKDLFILRRLSINDANFGQKWWRQKWKKGQGSSRPVAGGTGVNGLKKFDLHESEPVGETHFHMNGLA